MIKTDLHIHSKFCDGRDYPRDIIEEAIKKGMDTVGLSPHSYTFFDTHYCMKKERQDEYIETMHELKKEYEGRINVLCGIELDYYADIDTSKFDYIIGSVHYIKAGDDYLEVDGCPENTLKNVDKYYGGDYFAYIKDYFDTVGNVVCKTNCNIIGHFDLICKFNEQVHMFDENDERYVIFWKKAIDRLLPSGVPFEINTGAISRKNKTVPYPNADMIEYIRSKGGKFILSSDSHVKENLLFEFDKYEHLL